MLYFVYGLGSGGIEKYSINLYKYMDHEKFIVDIVTKRNENDFFNELLLSLKGKRIGISDYGNSKNKKILGYIKNLYSIAHNDYDIAYFNFSSPRAALKYIPICRLAGIKKIIIHSHNSNEENNKKIKKIMNFVGRFYINKTVNIKLACSELAASWMYGENKVLNNDYFLIKNGIEARMYDFNVNIRNELRTKLNIKNNEIVIGHIGRFVAQKNHKFLIKIFCEVNKINSSSRLVLIGIGELQNEIKKEVELLGLKDNVIFLGERNDINACLQMMDLFLLPSLYEGLPVVGIEAQASGLRCVFSSSVSKDADITGNITFIDLDKNEKYWADIILSLVPYERKSQLKTVIDAGYDIKNTAEKIEDIINEQCG